MTMLKKAILIIGCGLLFGGCSLAPKKSGVEIMSYPPAKVYIDGKEMGMTPYKNNELKPGEVEIKLATNDKTWTKKIELHNNINTVIDWELSGEEKEFGGYILYMEKTGDKNAGLLVNTVPEKAAVQIEGEIKGFSPTRINDIGEGDKQVTLSFPGYKSLNVFIKSVLGYQIVIEGKLIEEKGVSEEKKEEVLQSRIEKEVVIKETETGWLRVREASSSAAVEVAKVKPGDKYKLIEETVDWYKIAVESSKSGWVSTKYAEILK